MFAYFKQNAKLLFLIITHVCKKWHISWTRNLWLRHLRSSTQFFEIICNHNKFNKQILQNLKKWFFFGNENSKLMYSPHNFAVFSTIKEFLWFQLIFTKIKISNLYFILHSISEWKANLKKTSYADLIIRIVWNGTFLLSNESNTDFEKIFNYRILTQVTSRAIFAFSWRQQHLHSEMYPSSRM